MEKDNDFINSKDDEILMMSDHDSDTVITTEESIKEKEVNRKRKQSPLLLLHLQNETRLLPNLEHI